jgi:hypothetical protein
VPPSVPSLALAAAQERLLARRRALGITMPPRSGAAPSLADVANALPDHLGWGSPGLTRALSQLRATPPRRAPDPLPKPQPQSIAPTALQSQPPAPHSAPPETTLVYPDIALALLRQERVAEGRLWLILRALDVQGRGWLPLDEVRARLCEKGEPLRLCGPRQLRKLLRRGENHFWTRSNGRVWLRGTARVAAALDLDRLRHRPVRLPLAPLCAGIGRARAHLYATFHTSSPDRPISRRTLHKVTGASAQSQRNYERRLHLRPRRHFAVGPRDAPEHTEQMAWEHGRALFHLHDARGRMGPAGHTYLAWQLPNSYAAPASHRRGSGRRRHSINRHLTDLLQQGRTGNGQERRAERMTSPPAAAARRRFCDHARQAHHCGRLLPGATYWPADRSSSHTHFWHAMTR